MTSSSDFLAFDKRGLPAVLLEGVDFREIQAGKRLDVAWEEAVSTVLPEEEELEDEWEEVSDEEPAQPAQEPAVAIRRPPPAVDKEELSETILSLVNDAVESGNPLLLEDCFTEILDSLGLSVLVQKLHSKCGVQVVLADLYGFATVGELVDHVFQLKLQMPPPSPPSGAPFAAPPQPLRRTRRVVRSRQQQRTEKPLRAAGSQAPADAVALQPGVRVKIAGVTGRPELNGAGGTAVAYHHVERRWQVRLDSSLECKLFRERNLVALDCAKETTPGIEVILPDFQSPHVFIVHTLDVGLLDKGYIDVVRRMLPAHVCALIYDEEARQCESVNSLVNLYVDRALAEYEAKGGRLQGPMTLAGSGFGSTIAHEMAVQLSASKGGKTEVSLVLFDLDFVTPHAGFLAREGRAWLGGRVETALMYARLANSHSWADELERNIFMIKPAQRDPEDALMKVYWEVLAETGLSDRHFRQVVERFGEAFERLHTMFTGYVPVKTFQGPVDFVLSRGTAEAYIDDWHAAHMDRQH